MDVLMPDGTTITGVPEGITQSDLLARYNKFSTMQPAAKPARPAFEPTLSPEEQVMGAVGAPGEQVPAGAPGIKKPPSELAIGEELGKGAGAGVIGLQSMWENAGVMKDVGVLKTVRDRLDLFNKIETGQITSPDQLRGLDQTTSQARAYFAADPATREKMRARNEGEIGRRTDFVKASIDTLAQYQKDAEKYKGRTTDLTDVEGAKDFANWLSYNMGSGAVQMAPIMLAAATTGPAGVALLGTGMGTSEAIGNRLEFLQDKIKDMSPDQKAQAVIDYVQKTGDTSLAVGIISGAMDSVLGPAATLAKRGLGEVVKGETRKQALKAGVKELPKQMGEEFLTGGAQEATQIAGAVREKEQEKFLTEENLKKILNAAAAEAAGAVGGGGASTAARVYGAKGAPEQGLAALVPEQAAAEAVAPSAPIAPIAPSAPEVAPPSVSQDTEAMLQELIAPTIAPAIVEPTPTLQEGAVAEEKPAEAPVEAPAEPTLKEQYDKAAKLNFMAGDAFRNKLIDQDQLDKIRSDYERIKAEYQASIPKGELNPIQQEATDIADKLEALGLKPFADGMRTSIEKNQVGEQNLEFYRTKLKQEQAKAPKAEAGVERPSEKWDWADFYSDDTKGQEKLKLFNSKAKPEVKEALQTVSDSIQAVTDRLNDEGYTMYGPADLNVPKEIKDLRSQIQTLSANGSLLINKFEALNKGFNRSKKTTNQENLDKAIANAKAGAADAQKSLQRSIPEPEEVVKARQAVGEVSTTARKMETSSKSLWGSLINRLHPEEVREIFGNNPSLGEKKLQVTKKSGLRGSYLTDLVADGALDAYLPPANRHDSARFDEAEAAQYIKDAIANKDYLPYDVKREIEMAFASVSEAEALINEYLTIEEQNRELQVAADEQREAAQEAEVVEPEGEVRPAPADEGQAREPAEVIGAKESVEDEAAQVKNKTTREKLQEIADNLGVTVFETSDDFKSSTEGYVNIPPEDKMIEGVTPPDHIFAHELGHAIMQKRGLAFRGMPQEQVNRFIPGFEKIKEIARAFRPEMFKNKIPKFRRHAQKTDEIIADALGSFLLGKTTREQIQPLIDALGLTDYDLGTTKSDRRKYEEELIAYSKKDLEERAAKREKREAELKAQEKEAETKAKADEQAKDFVLTGSKREADQAAARGQKDIFAEAPKEDEGPLFLSLEPQTQTQAFKKWFGDSKVVDADGKPLRMYHGTDQDITAFRPYIFTTPNPKVAEQFPGGEEPVGQNIMPVYVRAENPFDYKNTSHINRLKSKIDNSELIQDIADGYWQSIESPDVLEAMQELGFDSFYVSELGAKNVAVFNPNQIKSATGNRGTFDESGNIANSLSDAMINGIEEENKKRSPSLIRTLKTYNRQLKDGRMSEEMYIMMSDAAIREDERNKLDKEIKDRERGADWIREKLLNAKRKGFLSEKAVDMAEWFIGQNPDLVYDLGISIRGKGEAGVGGFYNSLSRVINLIKEGSSDATTVHEILHHLERMMPAKVQDAIRKAWATQLVKAQKAAKTPAERLYFAALMDAHYGDNDLTRLNVPEGAGKAYSDARMALMDMRAGTSSAKLAEILLKMDVVPKELYQYFNASEFWAVNASRIVENRYDAVKAGNLARLKTWLSELGQKLKSLFGMKSDAAVLRALNSLSKATGEFQSDKMLGEGEYLNISARRNYEGNQPPAAKFESPEESKMDTLIYKLQDKLIDTKRVMQAIEKTSGEIAENWDVYKKEETYHGRLAKRTEDFLDDELMPIFKEMKEKGVSLDDLETYLHNRHAEEANAYIAKINPERPDGGSGIKTADAQAYLESLTEDQRTTYDSLASKIDKIIKGTQKLLVDTGLEKKEVIDNWNKAYEHYVPLERDNLDFVQSGRGVMGGFSTRGGASKRRVGSEKDVINIFANIALQRERALRRSEQARVGRALYGMAIKYPNPDFWLPINPDAIKDKEKLVAELKAMGLSDADAENIIQEPKEPQFDKKTGLVRYQVNPLLRNSPNVFPVRINGEDRFIIFNPNDPRAKRMVESLKNLDAEQLGAVLGTIGMATRWIASVNTQYNPVFGAWNFARDVQGAALNLSTTELAGREKEVLKSTWPALFAVYRDLRGKEGKTKESKAWIDMFERFQLAGGQTGYQNQFSETKKKANIVERELAKLDHSTARKAAESVFKWLSDYNDAMENSVRLAAFKVAVTPKADGGLGMSDDAAASLAKNLTVNFNRKGASSPILQSLYAFFNAAVQGNARLLKTLRGPAGKKIIVGGMTLGAFQAIALAMAGFDDDEPPDFVKDKNIVIPIGDGKYLTIPMPLGFNVFPGLGRLAMEAMLIGTGDIKSRKGAASKFGSAASLIVDSFNPLGSGSVQQMLTPTVADPLMALYANRDAFGRPISKEDRATAPTPGYERSRENASFFSQKLAEALNWLTSPAGTKHTKGWASPTADQIDYFIGQYTGGVGREIMKAGETAKSFVTKEEQPIYRVPILGKLYGETGTPAAISSKFYGNVTAMAEHEHEVKQRQKARESISEYYKENPEARLWQRANYIENQITRLNKEKKMLRERGASDDQIKRKEDQKIQLMKAFNDQVSKAQ